MLARRGHDRSAAAKLLGISTKSVTNLYRRPEPDGISDVTIARLAKLLGMTEPDVMIAWQRGLPSDSQTTGSKMKIPRSVLLTAWFERQDEAKQREIIDSLGSDPKASALLARAAARHKTKKKKG